MHLRKRLPNKLYIPSKNVTSDMLKVYETIGVEKANIEFIDERCERQVVKKEQTVDTSDVKQRRRDAGLEKIIIVTSESEESGEDQTVINSNNESSESEQMSENYGLKRDDIEVRCFEQNTEVIGLSSYDTDSEKRGSEQAIKDKSQKNGEIKKKDEKLSDDKRMNKNVIQTSDSRIMGKDYILKAETIKTIDGGPIDYDYTLKKDKLDTSDSDQTDDSHIRSEWKIETSDIDKADEAKGLEIDDTETMNKEQLFDNHIENVCSIETSDIEKMCRDESFECNKTEIKNKKKTDEGQTFKMTDIGTSDSQEMSQDKSNKKGNKNEFEIDSEPDVNCSNDTKNANPSVDVRNDQKEHLYDHFSTEKIGYFPGEKIGSDTNKKEEGGFFTSFLKKKGYSTDFNMKLTPDEYDKIRPIPTANMKKLILKPGWTHLLAEKFNETIPGCVLKFQYHKVQETNVRSKRPRCYIYAKAQCKHNDCGVWCMKIAEEPKANCPVVINVLELKAYINHQGGVSKKRQLSGPIRKEAQKRLLSESANSIYWSEYLKMPEAELQAENLTKCQSTDVLTKAKSEFKTSDILHPEPFTEIVLLNELFEEEGKHLWEVSADSYIKEIGYIPFMTVLYTADSLTVAKACIKRGSGVFYLDATGQIIRKLHTKRVLYYCMVMKEPEMPVVPVLEFIIDEHATQYITRPLLSFKTAMGQNSVPVRIELDFSWALIHSVLLSFNCMKIEEYIIKCHEVCTQKKECNFTVIHICCVNILRAVRVLLKVKEGDKGKREIILRMMALLINCTSLKKGTEIWKTFCEALNNQKKSTRVLKAIEKMNSLLKEASTDVLQEEESYSCNEDHGEEAFISKDEKEKSGIRANSPFRPIFAQYLLEEQNEDDGNENEYYMGHIMKQIGLSYMPLFPLWSGCMLELGKERDSNAPVEGWMKVVKRDVLMGDKNLRPGRFIKKMRLEVGGRLRMVKRRLEFRDQIETNKKTNKRKHGCVTELGEDQPKEQGKGNPEDDCEDFYTVKEEWNKKGKGIPKKPTRLFDPPKTIPVPKKRGKSPSEECKKRKGQNKNKNDQKTIQNVKNPPGLMNVGRSNSCWLNSTLQAIAALKDFKFEGGDRIIEESQNLIDILRVHQKEPVVLDPENLRELAWSILPFTQRNEQQDGAEFVQSLMENRDRPSVSLQHTTKCHTCGKMNSTGQSAHIVNVEIPFMRPTTVQDCLSEFEKEQVLTGDDHLFCTGCMRKTTHLSKTSIKSANPLIITLKRFRMAKSGRFLKETRPIRINRVLGMKGVGVYRLRAVQCHIGTSMQHGHYVTYTIDDQWTCRRCDDQSVKITHQLCIVGKEVQECSYVLYYEETTTEDVEVLIRNLSDIQLVQSGNIQLMGSDLLTLLPEGKLNDQVINVYFKIIGKSFTQIGVVDAFFSTCLVCKHDPDKFIKTDTFLKEMVLIPFILDDHWTLLVIYPAKKKITIYDSCDSGHEPLNLIRNYLMTTRNWNFSGNKVEQLPKQQNCQDCGVYVCQFALAIASGVKIMFNEKSIAGLRRRMMIEILSEQLL